MPNINRQRLTRLTPLRGAAYTAAQTWLWRNCYVETFAGCFPIAAFAFLAFAQNMEKSSTQLTPQNSGTTQLLIAVSPVNSACGLGTGTQWYVCLTTDGGKTLESRCRAGRRNAAIPRCARRQRQGRVSDVHWIKYTTDFRIYKTVDGGANGTMQFENRMPNAFYDCFSFWTPKRGIAHSDSVNGVFPDCDPPMERPGRISATICRRHYRVKLRSQPAVPAPRRRAGGTPGLPRVGQPREDPGHQGWG